MNPGADRLPGEVLEKIFSYLPCEDLVESVQFVCTWWQQVSREKELWKHVMYQPNAESKNVIQMLEKTPQLQILSLDSESVDNDLIQFITNSCPNLEHLHISWDSIYNNSDVTITHPMSQIKILSFFWGAKSRLDFPYLDSAFPNLESLNINPMKFNRKDLEQYLEKKQDSLHTLSLCCYANDRLCILPCLSVCTKLRNLSLFKICPEVLLCKEFGHLPNISHLTLQHSYMRDASDSSAMFCSFPNITALVMDGCIADESENIGCIIARNCPQLQKLKVSNYCACFAGYTWVEEEFIKNILLKAIHLKRVTHLCIYNDESVTGRDLEHLWLMPKLVHLDLYQCKWVTTQCVKLVCGFSKLEVLKFDLQNEPLPADLRASDVKNKNLQLMFYNCQDVSSLESLRRQHLRVGLTRYTNCKIRCSHVCRKVYCTCWIRRYDCILQSLSTGV